MFLHLTGFATKINYYDIKRLHQLGYTRHREIGHPGRGGYVSAGERGCEPPARQEQPGGHTPARLWLTIKRNFAP
jgi:hypothetical protein